MSSGIGMGLGESWDTWLDSEASEPRARAGDDGVRVVTTVKVTVRAIERLKECCPAKTLSSIVHGLHTVKTGQDHCCMFWLRRQHTSAS